MVTTTIRQIILRDLQKLKDEINLYTTEANLWTVDHAISNPAGNLCLHLVGNLNTYIGAVLGNTDYVRERELEFSLRDVPRAELIRKIDHTINVVDTVLSTLPEENIQQEYPLKVLTEKTSTAYFLVHLAAHLSYHLGQVNYHRRLLDV
jgi:uncharacterized damage-inducible protein DinB